MFPFVITVMNITDKRFSNSRIENIKKLLGTNVKKVKEYNVYWESEEAEINIFPNMIKIEFNNANFAIDIVKKLINVLEYRNIYHIECTYNRIVTSNDVDEYIKYAEKLVKINDFSSITDKAVVIKLEFVSIINGIPYLIGFSLENSDFTAKIEYIMVDENDIRFKESLFMELEKILDDAILDLASKESEINE